MKVLNEAPRPKLKQPAVAVGQVWKDNDPRCLVDRYISIVEVDVTNGVAYFFTSNRGGCALAGESKRKAQLKRFNGSKSGYIYHGTAVHK